MFGLALHSQVHHEGSVGPDPVLFVDVVLEGHSLLLKCGTRQIADEAFVL